MGNQLRLLIESILRNFSGFLGRKLRYWYYRTRFKSCGTNIIIEEGVYFENLRSIILGNNVWIDKNTILVAGAFQPRKRQYHLKGDCDIKWGDLILGDNVHVAPFVLIQAHGGVKIGSDVTIASGSKIYSLSHHYKNLNDSSDSKRYSFSSMAADEDQFLIVGNVTIEDKAAIGLNSILLPGSQIPKGTWVGVSSVINGNEVLKANTVVTSIK
jgi:galactoside O-acetyltransferase